MKRHGEELCPAPCLDFLYAPKANGSEIYSKNLKA